MANNAIQNLTTQSADGLIKMRLVKDLDNACVVELPKGFVQLGDEVIYQGMFMRVKRVTSTNKNGHNNPDRVLLRHGREATVEEKLS